MSATKTLKIGMSNTDKTNQATAIRLLVIAQLFQTYSSSSTYAVGDFCQKDGTIYKCTTAITTAEAWNSAHWAVATLNEVIDAVNQAVASVASKANVDGNYPTMKVGKSETSDNLTPYSEDSGTEQHEPFIAQGTGCGNGTNVVDTGSFAQIGEKRGNTICVNQHQISNNTDHNNTVGTYTYRDIALPSIDGYHKVIAIVDINITTLPSSAHLSLIGKDANGDHREITKAVTSGKRTYFIAGEVKNNDGYNAVIVRISNEDGENSVVYQDAEVYLIDLTQWFNGDVPADLLAHPENFFRYYQGSLAYNTGTIVNSNANILKCKPRNIWDEEWENGVYSYYDGGKSANPNYLRNKNPIKVAPNTDYYFKNNGTDNMVLFYDKDGEFIGFDAVNVQFKTPSNCYYICFYTNNATYNHNITISRYYEGESGYDKYYPYEELTEVDTGDEVLRSVGSAYDSKTPDGTITRRIKTDNVLYNKNWNYDSTYDYFFIDSGNYQDILNAIKCPTVQYKSANIRILGYDTVNDMYHQSNLPAKCICINLNGVVFFRDTSITAHEYNGCKTLINNLNGVEYEAKEPTEEQGTPFGANLDIDDFGQMEVGRAEDDNTPYNGVPACFSIFYPVDYKALIDTINIFLGGDGNNVLRMVDPDEDEAVSDDDPQTMAQLLAYINAQHAIEQANIGGALRHQLADKEEIDFLNTNVVDLSSLSWTYDANNHYFYASAPTDMATTHKGVCSVYKTGNYSAMINNDKIIHLSEIAYLYIHDNSYTDINSFNVAIKGVLLAYEKASE